LLQAQVGGREFHKFGGRIALWHDKLDLITLAHSLELSRLVQHAAPEDASVHPVHGDPNYLRLVLCELRSAIVDNDLQIVRITREKAPLEHRVIAPFVRH
jgi:hypothetical protein